jgi:hypothetical protein
VVFNVDLEEMDKGKIPTTAAYPAIIVPSMTDPQN